MSELYPTEEVLKTRELSSVVSVSTETIAYAVLVIDLIIGVGSAVLAFALCQFAFRRELDGLDVAAGMGLVSALFFAIFGRSWKLYDLPTLLAPKQLAYRALAAWFLAVALLISVLFALKESFEVSRGATMIHFVLFIVLIIATRKKIAGVLGALSARGVRFGRQAVVIGEEAELGKISGSSLVQDYGLRELGRVTIPSVRNGLVSKEGLLRSARDAVRVARDRNAEEIALAIEWGHTESLKVVVDMLRACPLPVRLLPDSMIMSMAGRRAGAPDWNDVSVELQRAPLNQSERMLKRSVDMILSTVGLIVLSPLLLMVAVAIKLDSRGPVIFRQRRAGFNGQQFTIYKFRSMYSTEDGPKIVQARRNDSRVTRIGKVIRQTSIDEIPQLFNVLQGDMSLIGPRPHALAHDDEYGGLLSQYAYRHHMKPGVTGWAQVNGSRGETVRLTDMKRRVELDLWYITNWSFRLDCFILARTCFDLISKRAY